ncbi:SDR family NAD(P)-dependent oxidoreductase [Acidisoma sp. S159]|uniref:SDR family NAD(P)-dependent oxidoreductase n=1 Tax=Acidisoma sp. S159 TaxID=1747225 RepID=UPI00131C9A5F|nr:SDR family NAD(P)-dependent oxidoreductase [Acidisoma sp. S159]
MSRIVASRIFTEADQLKFATLSGDFNPMHVDRVTARRTGAGAQVVHGMHNLLWCLGCVAQETTNSLPMASLRVNFDTFVTIGEQVEIALLQSDVTRIRVEARAGGVTVMTVLLGFGDKRAASPEPKSIVSFDADTAIDPPETEIETMSGAIPFAQPVAMIAAAFPHTARLLGDRGVAALGGFTRLVGMVCPGLHSIFNRITLEAADDDGTDYIGFQVTSASQMHRRIVSAVWGGGWVGSLTSMVRHRPTVQSSSEDVARLVVPNEFAGRNALVIGGSRGIGEVVAKLVAAGGGNTIITYAVGRSDAERVATEIKAQGGRCDVVKLDVGQPIAPQLASIETVPDQLYYFATPMIGGRRNALFETEKLANFLRFYVTGFYDCCQTLLAREPERLSALYPSSVFVEARPAGVVEYAMAKAAGEQLCQDMNESIANFHVMVSRLPRLATDQNPGFSGTSATPSVAEALLPLIRAMVQGGR